MIYLIGGSGYVGTAYQSLFRQKGVRYKSLKREDFDYCNPANLVTALQADRLSFLINAAGYTGKPNVDACENHKEECLHGNAVLPRIIADACAAARVP